MLVKKLIVPFCMLLTACNSNLGEGGVGMSSSAFADKPLNFKLHITDAPNDNLSSVFINIKHFEILVAGKGKAARVIMQENFGFLDLLTLQGNKSLPVGQFNIPNGLEIKQIRLLLEDGHYAIKTDNTRCELQTPSGQQSGVKILLKNKVVIEEGHSYSFLIDFDAKKSVVQKGNGDCLLKPVIKIKNALKVPLDFIEEDLDQGAEAGDPESGNDNNEFRDDYVGEVVEEDFDELANQDGVETITSGDNLDDIVDSEGFDLNDPSTWPEGITPDMLGSYF